MKRSIVVAALGTAQTLAWGSSYYLPAILADPIAQGLGLSRTTVFGLSPVREIVHDEQSQFERTLRQWHAVFSRPDLAKVEPWYWPGENEPLTLSKAPGSKFRMARADR